MFGVWRFFWRHLCSEALDVLLVRVAFLCCCFRDAQCDLQALHVIGRPTSQSTTYRSPRYNLPSSRANDGCTDSFSHTSQNDTHPWWKLDLGGEHCLGQITVQLRVHCCGPRFIGATARAGLSSDYAVNQRCGQPATSSQASTGAINVFLCDPPVVARWVSFDIDPSYPGVTEAVLQLAEVSVMEYTWECNPKTTPVPPAPPKLRSASFAVLHNGYKMRNPGPLSSESARRPTLCAGYCMKHSRCFSFDFSRAQEQCHLHSVNASDVQPVADAEFCIYEILH